MMTCMAYCINAIISPTCMAEAAICCAPVQMMSRLTPFIISIITGIINTITRVTNRFVFVSSSFAA